MTTQEINYLKNMTFADFKKLNPSVIEEDFGLMKCIIEDNLNEIVDNCPDLNSALMWVFDSLVNQLNLSKNGMISMATSLNRDNKINKLLGGSK